MKTKHTPGPWEVKIHDHGPYFTEVEVWHENHGCIAILPNNSSIWNSEKKEKIAREALNQTIANATVMAAALELLDACKEALRMYESIQPAGGWQGVYEELKIAIKKATS